MRYFNTSGPNIPKKHYTIERTELINRGIELVKDERYFTIWAPRQTGKSTYFRQLAVKLIEQGYKVAHINFENFKNSPLDNFVYDLTKYIKEYWGQDYQDEKDISKIFSLITENKKDKCVLIIDEVEGINSEYFGDFLHSIRNAYHSRESHCLKSVILVGVSNIVGVVSDNASPFNIADNLNVPYFTSEEVYELLGQHESETLQLFDKKVKDKICEITAGQPGLVNGFAQRLISTNLDKKTIDFNDYLEVEDWYLTEAIDKNIANILNKASEERAFVERLLFTEQKILYDIDRPSIKLLHTNGLIKKDKNGFVAFWVPFYKKRAYKAFYPYTNGEQNEIGRKIFEEDYFTENNELKIDKLIKTYKEYIKRRGFNPHREKDENGNYKSIKEAALIYSFETYIHAMINELDGKIYREANTGLGKSDMIINVRNKEYIIETKVYSSPKRFEKGKRQLSYYCSRSNLTKGLYLVYYPSNIGLLDRIKEDVEMIDGVEIRTYLVTYDETKW